MKVEVNNMGYMTANQAAKNGIFLNAEYKYYALKTG